MLRFLILLLPIFLFAHKVNLFLDLKDENLYINSYFANAKPCLNCKFQIEDENNNVILEDALNEDGEYNFKTKLQNLKVTIDAGAGHKVFKTVELEESSKEDKSISSDNSELNSLKEENLALKNKISVLEEQLDYFEIFKVIFGLLIIYLIFLVIKRVKS